MTLALSCAGTCVQGYRVQNQEKPAAAAASPDFEVVVMAKLDGGAWEPSMVKLRDLDAFTAAHPERTFQVRREDARRVDAMLREPGFLDPPHLDVVDFPDGGQELTLSGQLYDDTPIFRTTWRASPNGVEPLVSKSISMVPTSLLAHGLERFPITFAICGAFSALLLFLNRKLRG